MSEFYKRKKKEILKNYQFLGIGERWMFYLTRFLLIILCFYIILILSKNVTEPSLDLSGSIFILIVLSFVIYLISAKQSRSHTEMRNKALNSFIIDPEITEKNLNNLISEIEKNINKSKSFSVWAAGSLSTIIILVATLTSNLSFKVWDELHNVFTKEEMEIITDSVVSLVNASNNDLLSVMLNFASNIFLILASIVFGIYLVFSMTTYMQKHMLVFLYDAQYVMDKNKNETSIID